MAIDDNTSYELTGEQVKDLASKINAKADSSSLATVATSGLYSDLSGTPTIPTKTSDLTNDGADNTSTYVEADELATVATSGSYADLSNKPTIPTVNDATLTITQNGTSAGTFTANASSNTTIALTDTTYSAMTGATSGTAGTSGLVPAPSAGDQDKVLKGDGTWGAAADTATVIYMVKTADSGTHDYTVVFYTELAHTNTVSYSTINGYVTEGKSVLIVDGNKSSGSPLAAVTGSPKGSGPMNTVVDGALYKFSYSSGTTYLDIDGILSADPIQSIAGITPPIQTSMIADGAVTTDKLGASSVTNAKIDWSTVGSTSSGALRVVTRDAYRTVTQGTYTVFTDDASPVIPSGYTPIGLVGLEMSGAGYTSMTMTTHYISGNTITWCCQSPINWDTGIHFYWRILCVKTS